jgi:two-component system OmpR family response regulator
MEHGDLEAWPRRQEPDGRRSPHVLVAEDDAEFRDLLAQAFRRDGCQVTECEDGPGLVAKLGSYLLFSSPTPIDLVVSDIRMPGATALEILEAMRECRGIPPVILITAFPSSDTREAARLLGVAAVLEKPFEIEELITRSRDLLSRHRAATA